MELRCSAQRLIEDEDFVNRLRSTYTSRKPTEFEIQEMVNILVSGEDGKFKFGMEIKNTMIDDAFKKIAGYKYYKANKVESKNEANVPKLFKKNDVPRKTRTLTVAEETIAVELAKSISIKEPRTQQRRRSQLTIDSQIDEDVADTYAEWGQKLKGPAVDDPAV
ncbi:hypothetical protein Tco_1185703 [Tanacetum coccineum]